jgi:peptide/nickel transport system permease protein
MMVAGEAGTIIAAAALLWLLACALMPHVLAPGDPLAVHPSHAFRPPSPTAPFGTDESGRDVYTRVVHGAATSLAIGLGATALGIILGIILGTMAGLGPRWLDFGTSRLLEVLFSFPGLVLALLVIVIYGPGAATSAIAVGLATAPGYARIIRSQLITVRRAPFIEALVVLGRGPLHRFAHSILPSVAGALFALVTLGIGQSIVGASSLSFLGLGAPPPAAEWGAMLAAGRIYLASAWWMTFFPGLAIVLAAGACTMLGRRFQERARRA